MKPRALVSFVVSFVAAAALLAQAAPSKPNEPGATGSSTKPEFVQPTDLKWGDLNPTGAPGVKIADVWGNHALGGFGAFVKFPPGFEAPLHTHTHTIKIVVISGTYIQTPDGGTPHRMGPGSYVYQPGGNYRHVSACDKASECTIFIESNGKFDLKPVGAGKAMK
jgi:quercetin dioxygenase-like cupin family protein